MIRYLLVSNDKALRGQITAALQELGYECLEAADAEKALELLDHNAVQLILADVNCGACELTHELREAGDKVAVLTIAENLGRAERRRIFRSGADGYLDLPLDDEELQMRVKNLLWRCRIVEEGVLRFGSCTLYSATLTVESPTATVVLRRMEFLLLEKLLSYPGRIFTRAQLMDELWGYDSDSTPRTVDTHVKLLRKKLKGMEEIRIQTVRGLGYRAATPRRLREGKGF